jgi:hypothetical protein
LFGFEASQLEDAVRWGCGDEAAADCELCERIVEALGAWPDQVEAGDRCACCDMFAADRESRLGEAWEEALATEFARSYLGCLAPEVGSVVGAFCWAVWVERLGPRRISGAAWYGCPR